MMERWTVSILFANSVVGYLAQEETYSKCNDRVIKLCTFLRTRRPRSLFLEDMLTFSLYIRNAGQAKVAQRHLETYLDSLRDSDEPIRRGIAHIKMADARNFEAGRETEVVSHLDQAFHLLTRSNHLYGLALCQFRRICLAQQETRTLKERIRDLIDLSADFGKVGAASPWWSCVSTAIAWMELPSDSFSDFSSCVTLIKNALEQVHNRHAILSLECFLMRPWIFDPTNIYQVHQQLEGLLERPHRGLVPDLEHLILRSLTRCCDIMFDRSGASRWSQRLFESRVSKLNIAERSSALEHLARCRKVELEVKLHLIPRTAHDQRMQSLQQLYYEMARLEEWIERDIQHGLFRFCEQKRSLHADLLRVMHREDSEGFSTQMTEGNRHLSTTDGKEAPEGGYFGFTDLVTLQQQGKHKEALKSAQSSLARVMEEKRWSMLVQGYANFVCACACVNVIKYSSPGIPHVELDSIRDILLLTSRKAVELEEKAGLELTVLTRSYPYLLALTWAIKFQKSMEKEQLFKEAESFLEKVHRQLETHRRRTSGSPDMESFARKRDVVSTGVISDVYKYAGQFYLEFDKLAITWKWMQRGKGRALLEILRRREISEGSLATALAKVDLVEATTTTDPRSLTQIDVSISDAKPTTLESSAASKIELKSGLSTLADSLATKVPRYVVIAEDFKLFSRVADQMSGGTKAFLIDWFIPSSRQAASGLSTLIVSCRTWLIDKFSQGQLLERHVQEWADEHLDFHPDEPKPLEYKKGALKPLRHLMVGIEEMTSEGDLLVLTPSAPLSLLPLHAIAVDGAPLIERNQVVYSSSLALMKQCISRSRDPDFRSGRRLEDAIFTAAFEAPDGKVEREEILSSVAAIAEHFAASKILGKELTVAAFRNALESSSWIHYHGHAHYERLDGLKQYFDLSSKLPSDTTCSAPSYRADAEDPNAHADEADPSQDFLVPPYLNTILSSPATDTTSGSQSSTRLTAAEIFSMTLPPGAFICCIACDSGSHDAYGGTEPFGLVPALLCAGAASVLGTLWPIESETGRTFSRHFYASVETQLGEAEASGTDAINLARAVGEAVGEVRKWRTDPYSWAAFVLHGAPLYRFR